MRKKNTLDFKISKCCNICAGCVRPRVRSSTLGVRISRLERRRGKGWIKGPIERVELSEYSKLMDSEKELEATDNVPDE